MSSTIGNLFKVSVFGESHGKSIGVTISGVPSGITIDFEALDLLLERRRGIKEISTSRREKDQYKIISGYFNNKTTGTPLTFIIDNLDVDDSVYDETKDLLRPGHADYTAYLKYRGNQDYRGGGHFSGRLTTCLVIAGAIAKQLLNSKGITLASRVKQIYDVKDDEVNSNDIKKIIEDFSLQEFPTISSLKKEEMIKRIKEARNSLDSLGGIIETYVDINSFVIGDPLFDSVESKLSSYLFSIGGIKGVSFGRGFELASLKGSEANDAYQIIDGKIRTLTNNNGGINGGITCGEPIIFSSVVKPTPSISLKQQTVNVKTLENVSLNIKGRHDPCIATRALYVINAMTSLALVDLLMEEYGKGFFVGE